ncbi:MAG: beta-N-acetylhexosaminidase, partial [Actinomycetota bacterium]|nr:beta-N-acetylhexosaminidase [Actinomycetota bacterium]
MAVTLAACIALPVALLASSPSGATAALAVTPAAAETRPTTKPSCTPASLTARAAAVLVVGLPGVTTAADPAAQQVMDLGISGVFLAASNVRT